VPELSARSTGEVTVAIYSRRAAKISRRWKGFLPARVAAQQRRSRVRVCELSTGIAGRAPGRRLGVGVLLRPAYSTAVVPTVDIFLAVVIFFDNHGPWQGDSNAASTSARAL
jgi:hypothetical protein